MLRRAPRLHPRAILVAGCALALLLLAPASAGAHAVLVTTTPSWGGVVQEDPHQIRLEYDEDVVPQFARVTVVGPNGQDLGRPPQVSGNVVLVALRPGPTGSYTVRWRMVSSDDGHVTQGAYSFGVRATPLPPAPVSGISVPVAPELLAWLELLGVALAGGLLIFRALVWAPAARELGERGGRETSVAIWVAVAGAALALHAGLFGFLIGAYPIVGGGVLNLVNTQIIPIRVATHAGQAFTLMTFAWLGVLTLLVGAWVAPRRREPLLASAGLLSLGTAFGISWASHPDSRGTLALAADYAHLLAAALWIGGLVGLAILVGVTRPLSRSAREAIARTCLLRFSRFAAPCVLVLALAGVYLAVRQLPRLSALTTTGYGVTILFKSALFIAALGLAAYHNRRVVPRIAGGAPIATIRRTLVLEGTLLLLALVLAAILGQSAPPT